MIETKNWDKRNVWPLASGELAVRPTLRNLEALHADFTIGANHFAGFSVKNPRTEEVWHYVLGQADNELKILIYPDNWSYYVQEVSVGPLNGVAPEKPGFSYAIVEDEIIISSPLFPTYWGIIGGGLTRALKQDSVNPNTTAVDVPRGISVGWAGRCVIASQDGVMWFSDALAPRTYVAQNAVNPPGGTIYGLHVNAGGALIVCTTTGVYALPEDAAASGQIVLGIFSKLTDYATIDFDTTCICKGKVFGLTQRGYRLIDEQNAKDIELDEQFDGHFVTPRMHFADYRQGRILGGQEGPIVVMGKYAHMTDLSSGLKTWWFGSDLETDAATEFRAVLFAADGEEFYLTYTFGPAWKTGCSLEVSAHLTGRIPVPPGLSPVVRHIDFASNSNADYTVSLNNASQTKAFFASAPIIGTTAWETGVYREAEIRSRQTDWAVRGDQITVNIAIKNWPSLIPDIVEVVFKGPGKKRADN